MNFLVSLILGILRMLLPALLSARPTCERADPQSDLREKLRQRIRRHWGVCVLLVALAGCGPKTVYVPSGTPVRLLAFAVRYLPLAVSRPFLAKAVGGGRGAKMPSFHIDLHSGRGKSEVDYLNGAVVRAGAEAGIPTPVNQLLTDTLLQLTNNELPMAQFSRQPERLLQLQV